MTFFQSLAAILVVAAVASYINARYLKWPPTVGLLVISLAGSLIVILLGELEIISLTDAERIVKTINFEEVVLNGMLAFLLFAGALHVDLERLRRQKVPITIMATAGVAGATFITGTLFWLAADLVGFDLPYPWALLFGALIAPTDPIAVLGILKGVKAPKSLETKIAGESLFNDGIAIVVFLTILETVSSHTDPTPGSVSLFLLEEAVGGAALGLVLGFAAFYLMRSLDDYATELLLTLALVTGGYALAVAIHVSGPIAVVVAGIVIGNHARQLAMSTLTREHLDTFWELVDSVLNAALFILIGLEVIIISVTSSAVRLGLLAIPIMLVARFISVSIPISLIRLTSSRVFSDGAIRIMTWGGLRGGISIALALSLPQSEFRDVLVTATYIVVVFSIVVQGLTFGRLVISLHPQPDVELDTDFDVEPLSNAP
ncbi:MAG: sodium:proton antiporter [Chloroflexi bacterium]|nr:sodium:proton antiporter [Chloroflexota bacterium]MDA1296387.1 sodium:proton antiporter [Chloroflexota bacterium]